MNRLNYTGLLRISYKESCEFFKKYHYIGKGLICPLHLGYFENGVLTSCASFGYLPSPFIPKTVWRCGSNENTWELRRLSSISKMKNAESFFISRCISFIRAHYPNIKLIFSYADEKAGHVGIIYRASGFLNWPNFFRGVAPYHFALPGLWITTN